MPTVQDELAANCRMWYEQNIDLINQRDAIFEENKRLRETMRRAVDIAWGRALEDGSVPSSKIVNEIIASARGLALPLNG